MPSRQTEKLDAKSAKGPKYAPHNREKNHCKKCRDPIKVNIEQWIFSRRQYDKKRNIYDADIYRQVLSGRTR